MNGLESQSRYLVKTGQSMLSVEKNAQRGRDNTKDAALPAKATGFWDYHLGDTDTCRELRGQAILPTELNATLQAYKLYCQQASKNREPRLKIATI